MLAKITNKMVNFIRLQQARKRVTSGYAPEGGWDINTTQSYWREECNKDNNFPDQYITSQNNRYEYVVDLLNKTTLVHDSPILELGSNSGKGLSCFYEKGYQNLTGVEINPLAVEIMQQTFPMVFQHSKIINASLEDCLPKLADQSFSLVYSMFTLFAIHPAYNSVFEHIARIAKNYIITVESENGISAKIYPRNYKKIFEKLGFKQIFFEMTAGKIQNYDNLHARVFERIN